MHADPDLRRVFGPFEYDRAVDWLRTVERNWREYGCGRVAIADRATKRLLGRTGVMYLPEFRETELGWTLRRDAWGHGYATEAARACGDWIFRDFDIPHLISLIEPENHRSVLVAERLGMAPWPRSTAHPSAPAVGAKTPSASKVNPVARTPTTDGDFCGARAERPRTIIPTHCRKPVGLALELVAESPDS
jgi:RimJ/RimL family protein N-acetyltransferase